MGLAIGIGIGPALALSAVASGDGSPAWTQGAVDLDFANSRYWQAGVEYASYAAWAATVTVSVSVDTDATYFDASGVLQNASANALRFDHDPSTLASYGLLMEGARTNLRTKSVAFDNAAWSAVRVTTSANQVVAPDGTTVADNILETAVTNTFHLDGGSVTVSVGQLYTESFFFKKLGRRYVTMDTVNIGAQTTIDIDGASVQAGSGPERGTGFAQALANGWVRGAQSMTETVSTSSGSMRIFLNDLATDGISASHAGDITKGVTAWGGQFEAGAFPSSFIRTDTASVARSADTFIETVAHEAAGSVRLYFRTPAGKEGNQVLWQRDDGTESNRIRCVRASDGHLHWIVSNGGTDVVDIDLGVVTDWTKGYTDFSWATDNYAASLNGGAVSTDSSGTMPAGLTTIRRGHQVDGTSNWFGHLLREVRGVTKGGAAPFEVSFGFVTDEHYFLAKDNHDNRYGHDVPAKMADAIAVFNSRPLDFVLNGGDIVEHYGETHQQAMDELATIVGVFNTTTVPRYHTVGNHDLDLLHFSEFVAATGIDPQGYYSFDVLGKLHVVVLDCMYLADDDVSHEDANGNVLVDTYHVGPAQRTWLAADLAATSLPTLVMCHCWLSGDGSDYVANAAAVRTILEASGKVEWVLSGHNHRNDFKTINGIRYFGMNYEVEGAEPDNAYAVITITDDRIIVEGFVRQASYNVVRL